MEAMPKLAAAPAAVAQQSSLEQHILEKKLAMLQNESSMNQERCEKFTEHYLMQLKANEAQRSLK